VQPDEFFVPALGRPALLWSSGSAEPTRAAVVALHGSALPQADQPLFGHLGRTLAPTGVVVSSFDRQATLSGEDTPLAIQVRDALVMCSWLRSRLDVPVGIFGFSQGAWAAVRAASEATDVAFLILVGCSGVSPGEQMRFHTTELLRRAGYPASARQQQLEARIAMEDFLRGTGSLEPANRLLEAASAEPWFELAYLPRVLDPGQRWDDMDYDPAPDLQRIQCPTLLFYGEDEDCVPPEASKQVWTRAARESGLRDLTVVDLPSCGHFPAPGADSVSREPPSTGFSNEYTSALVDWMVRH
jgi:uncharacterized protein